MLNMSDMSPACHYHYISLLLPPRVLIQAADGRMEERTLSSRKIFPFLPSPPALRLRPFVASFLAGPVVAAVSGCGLRDDSASASGAIVAEYLN